MKGKDFQAWWLFTEKECLVHLYMQEYKIMSPYDEWVYENVVCIILKSMDGRVYAVC